MVSTTAAGLDAKSARPKKERRSIWQRSPTSGRPGLPRRTDREESGGRGDRETAVRCSRNGNKGPAGSQGWSTPGERCTPGWVAANSDWRESVIDFKVVPVNTDTVAGHCIRVWEKRHPLEKTVVYCGGQELHLQEDWPVDNWLKGFHR